MKFIPKVASYLDAYTNADNKEGILKVASEEGVTSDDLVAYHNLTEGNIFTGENIIQIEGDASKSESPLIQLGFTIDKVASEGLDESIIFETAKNLGMDDEDVAFVISQLQKQAEEAGIVENKETNEEQEKIANAITMLKEAGLDPKEAIEIALNVDEEGNFTDEKVAEAAAKYTEEDFDKIAEAMEMIGEITPEKASLILELIEA